MANGLNMHELAREGAAIKLQNLEHQATIIRKAFPDLNGFVREKVGTSTPKRRTWHMSAKARKAAAVRMKAYWAKRRQKAA